MEKSKNSVNGNYYIIKKKQMADTINFITGMRYYIWDCEKEEGKKIYSFEITPKFLEAFDKINELKHYFSQM